MELSYKNKKLQDLCENPVFQKELNRLYGKEVSQNLPIRIKQLKAFESLNDVPSSLPFRRHKLSGNKKNMFAINITRQYRLIFQENENKIIIENLSEIKRIKVMEVSKHYE